MLKQFKNLIINQKFYWILRHLIKPNIWSTYYRDSPSKRRDFYSKFIQQYNLKAIFEFGCASGPNLFSMDKNVPWNLSYFGYDISSKAIKFAKKKSQKDSYFFTSKISPKLINSKLDNWKIKKFDLGIYDRVLYLLSENEIKKHFENYKDYMRYLIIDDFHNSETTEKNDAYFSKNYEIILLEFGFNLKKNEPSEHIIGNDEFFIRNARRLIFEKEK
ncbi:hypothetical protein PMT9312_1309 [Prochlorococcus marinus str. MIT 9312]|uniref:Uncharacterized protein n=1 Tax=Prochlorococcus marinus (strain MIT 9312) TaxID=74546 RepID=Q319S7_PROM9|nr:methyltransferase domain-containing protein [Prochlorococcus marinus]ABB50368.1 hypothetical protein PMT9312_1309 [Prochlorococcus marinus str. MIT 9312]KGF99962.1 hypothetical protein EU97_1096 [Prochlorococcus marinus str. MIT 9311]